MIPNLSADAKLTISKVGLIGLGNMGSAISANLVSERWEVVGFDTDPARCENARLAGVQVKTSAADVARHCDTIMLSLPSFSVASAVLTEVGSARHGRQLTIIETSTLRADEKEQLRLRAERAGHVLLDCPISGTSAQARVRDIVIYASGIEQSVDECMILFQAFGRPKSVGAFGNGTRVKILANLLVAIHNVAAAECLALAERAGLDLGMVLEVLSIGAGSSKMLQVRGPMMIAGNFQPATMALDLWQKDLCIISDLTSEVGGRAPLFDAARRLYEDAFERGWGDEDTAVVFRLLKEQSSEADISRATSG